MKFRVVIWHWNNKLFDKEVEYATQALADAFTMGLYHAFDSIGKKPTGMQTLPIKDVLSVGDVVNWRGSWGSDEPKQAKVEQIYKAQYLGDKEGKRVKQADWSDVKDRDYIIDLDNGHWCYANQISKI
jgi:hypothetical protein